MRKDCARDTPIFISFQHSGYFRFPAARSEQKRKNNHPPPFRNFAPHGILNAPDCRIADKWGRVIAKCHLNSAPKKDTRVINDTSIARHFKRAAIS
jgi:hypothetical protein